MNLIRLNSLRLSNCSPWVGTYVKGEDLSPDKSSERTSLKEVVLENRLSANIKRINPWISDQNLHKVVKDLTKTQYTNLIEANQAIWTNINECVSVMQDLGKGNKGQTVHIIDFENPENNEFLCTNQFKVSGVNQNIIPDIILFVNGLPLAVIECKSPTSPTRWSQGLTNFCDMQTVEHLKMMKVQRNYSTTIR